MNCYMHRWAHWRFPYFCTYCLIQCFVHSWTQCCFPCFIHIVFCSVTYTVGHTGVFPVLYILFDAVFRAPLDTFVFSLFFYTLFDAVFHSPFDTLAFFLFLYMLFDRLFHAQLDTLVFSLFNTYCLNQCYMHLWTQLCFPYFFWHTV